ncbi:MAG: glycosyltransferase [Bacteroidota bacterium]|nr:glycosyltransferase [Bacteroidota bacterium]
MNPAITVLMPVYNAEKYLKEAIDSILNQTHLDFEFLIIDDGSTDSSIEIINSYNDSRIRLVQNEQNFGITYSLNRGIHLASNELIARMDADDISHPTRLEKQYMYAQKYPEIALISAWIRRISSDGKFEKISGLDTYDIYYTLLFSPRGIYHPVVMFRKSAVLDVGMYSKKYAEDFNLWCKMIKKYRFHVIPEPLLDYRSSETSVWRITKKKEHEKAHFEQIVENVKFFTNDRCQLTDYEANFLTGRIDFITKLKKRKFIINSFKKLDFITDCFQTYQNINNPVKRNINEIAFWYKFYLIGKLSRRLKNKELFLIMLQLKYWRLLFIYIQQKIQRKRRGRESSNQKYKLEHRNMI